MNCPACDTPMERGAMFRTDAGDAAGPMADWWCDACKTRIVTCAEARYARAVADFIRGRFEPETRPGAK